MPPTILVSTWRDGVSVITGAESRLELVGQSVGALARDGHGHVIAIVDGEMLRRRTDAGDWTTIATSVCPLACVVAVGDSLYVGTDDARVLRVRASGELEPLGSFENVPGRATWFAGSALVDGQLVGPPLGVRSITATADGTVLLANVHVGGIPRSTDGGTTWHATIDIHSDVHQVLAHPSDPDLVIAATARGLGISRDGGATWVIERDGLPAPYCSAVAFSGYDVLVSASAHHFASQGALYRRTLDGHGALVAVGAGLPPWMNGIVDTRCIDVRASTMAVADHGGNLYVSMDGGDAWEHRLAGLSAPSSVLVV